MPSEQTEAHASAPAAVARRVVVYVAGAAAFLLIGWSLFQAGERDLGTQPSVLLPLLKAAVAS